MDFYIKHQLDLLMVLSGICAFLFIFLFCMKMSNKSKKSSYLQISFFSMTMLLCDRLAYIYRGDESSLGYWMVRISNFMVFASLILVDNGFNNYLLSVAKDKENNQKKLSLLRVSRILAIIGIALLVISQFTGLYYTFDDTNHYVRSSLYIVSYIIPVLMTALQFVYIVKNRDNFRKNIFVALILFIILPVVAGLVQIGFYGVSLISVAVAVSALFIYFAVLMDQNTILIAAAQKEKETAIEVRRRSNDFLQQTVEALASAVDAKDPYTHGHSTRVAKYSRKIAEMAGMSEQECEKIYLAGLLHDVGKVGIDDEIINKKGKLTDEQFDKIKSHSSTGGQILSKIVVSPYLSVGARYHHERYDGNGYPEKLKGEDIPNIARIIAVADAYDAMTSTRSYRDLIPQMYVREELIKGMGTQFDPEYAKIMLQLLDQDPDYLLKEQQDEEVFGSDLSYEFETYKSKVSVGARVTECPMLIKLQYKATKPGGQPTLLFYDSADAQYYLEDNSLSGEMDFIEFASVDLDGEVYPDYVREYKRTKVNENKSKSEVNKVYTANVFVVKQDDHMLVKVSTDKGVDETVFALYDASRYVYLALTGENCSLEILDVDVAEQEVEPDYIPRIAEKISYIDVAAGDIPNVQVDGWTSSRSEILEFSDQMKISFHTMSLPSSRRVWHCPILALFTSDDGTVEGPNYRDVAFVRLDGEIWNDTHIVENKTVATKTDEFDNWSIWKQKNKTGVDCTVSLSHNGDVIHLETENSGLIIENQSKLPEEVSKVYFYFTGDQCAITNIRVSKEQDN